MLGATRRYQGHQGCRGCQGCIGAGREYRYSGTRRGIGGIMGHLGVLKGVGAIKG